jgi:Putative phage tail protein
MGFLRRNDNAKPDYTALQLQTSTSTLPIPIVWGQNRISPNLIWYANFQAVPAGSGKGVGGKGGAVSSAKGSNSAAAGADYTYTADLIMALCEGPIAGGPNAPFDTGIGIIWKNLAIYTPLELGLGSYPGSTPQAVWPYLADVYPYNALAYQGTAYLWGAGYNLGDSASIGNHNVEIYGPFAGTGANGIDADPALVINDFLTNQQYGAQFNPASIDSTTLFGSGGDASLQTYCKAMGLAFSPALVSQEQGSSILARWMQLLSCAAVWSGGLLKFIPYGDTAISAGNPTTQQAQFSVPAPVPETSTGFKPPSFVTVCAPQNFVSDGGVVYAFNNFPFVFIGAAAPTAAGTYGMISPGQYIFAALDYGQPVKITWTAAPTTSYVPNMTPAYALTDDNYVDEKGNKDPAQVERVDVFSLPTIQRITVSARDNQYASMPVEARDQSQIEIFGPRVGPTISAQEICDENVIGPLVAQTILQRELYVRTKFTFKLSWEYCLLDPMDIVTLTDTNLGLSNYPVRVIQIEEDDKGLLAFTCEELVTGVSTPAFYPNASAAGSFQPNWGVPALPVNTPLIFEPPPGLTGGVAQVWFGASGINGGGGSQWGGANVYISIDDVTYSQIAVLTAPLRQGFLSASLGAASGWDSVDTLAVNLAESGGTLAGTSQAAAQAGATMSLVDSELIAYETATLTSGNAYNLTGLARGLGGSVGAPHSSGAPFARLDGAVARYDLPANFVGQTIYFKFQSFNVFGGGAEELSVCAVYSFTPIYASTVVTSTPPNTPPTPPADPIAAQLLTGFALNLGSVESAPTIADNFGSVTGGVVDVINLGAVAATATHPIAVQLLSGSPLNLGATTSYPSVTDNFGSVNDAVSQTIDLGAV